MVGLFQSHAVALDGFHHLVDGSILCYHVVLQLYSHTLQADTLLFGHALCGHTCHHRYHFGHLVGIHHLSLFVFAIGPALVQLFQLFGQRGLAVAIACSQFVVLVLHRFLFLFAGFGQLMLLLDNLGWNMGVAKVHLRTRLVECVDGLVGHKAVGDIAVCQFDTGFECSVSICHMVVHLVAVLDVVQYLQCLLVGGRLHLHLLESALQGTVFLNALAILVERGGANALDGATRQGGLHDVGSVHTARCSASTDNGVYLVDKYNHVGVRLQLLHQGFQSLFKLSAILGSCHHASHIQRVDALAKQHGTAVVGLNQLCQPLNDGALTNTRLANQYGVVLFAAP